jgi:peptidoglycan/xylan/chitin deacetylase (PgdA/CDA1 family)
MERWNSSCNAKESDGAPRMAEKIRQVVKRALYRGASFGGPHRWPSLRPRLWVLMYHRILPADDPRAATEEPGMVVTPGTLRHHIAWLRSRFELVSLANWLDRTAAGRPVPRRAVALTFDDGWHDNYEFAFPILKETHSPATLFAVSHMIGTSDCFWPNRLARMLSANGVVATAHATGLEWLSSQRKCTGTEHLSRIEISNLISACKRHTDEDMRARLDRAESTLSIPEESAPALMDWQQLNEMVDSGLVEVGSHTCRHTRLNVGCPTGVIAKEVLDSQDRLERMLNRRVRLFCYPNGDASPDALSLVASNYDAAVTTRVGINSAGTPRHELRRIRLHEDVSGQPHSFFARLSTWI